MASNYGPMVVSKNGKSLMNFDVEVLQLHFKAGKMVKSEDIALWIAEAPAQLSLKKGKALKDHAATTVYKVVVVEVKPFLHFCAL